MTAAPAAVRGTAVITGGGSGIGAATAVTLSEAGFRIAVLDRDGSRAEAVADSLPGAAVSIACDVTSTRAVESAIDAVLDRWGTIDSVVASAGIAVGGDVATLTDEAWERSIDVNLNGVFRVARAALPALEATGGCLTAIASDAGIRGSQGYAAYSASKHGVVGLIRSLALEWGPRGVRANAICPGFVETPMADQFLADASPAQVASYRAKIPLGRFASPHEVAIVVRHLTIEAPYATGSVYSLDGGSTAGPFHPAT